MATAPSHEEREGAARTPPDAPGQAAQGSAAHMARRGQGIDYDETTDVVRLNPPGVLDRKTVTIVSGPISLWTLALWGLVLFLIGFFHGREVSSVQTSAVEVAGRELGAATATPASTGAPASAPAQSNAAALRKVTIKLLKYSSETIEIRKGEAVEWANDDLTPHTVTSQGAGDLNSGSIEAGASWRHTFTQSGSFPYFCTFHPEMKGMIVVK